MDRAMNGHRRAMKADPDGRSVLGRAASIIGAFDDGSPVLALSDLSHRTGLPKSTAHRLAEQLVELGWLERDHSGYLVGMRLFELGNLAGRRSRLRDKALPHLQALSSSTGMAVNLGILDGGDVVYLERVLLRQFELPTRDGGRMPAYCTGIGKAMLAFAGDDEVERVIEQGLAPRTPYTIVLPELFRDEMATVRHDGVAHDREEAYRGISCVAAPIRGSGRAIAAVSVSGPRADAGALGVAVRSTAKHIWADLFG